MNLTVKDIYNRLSTQVDQDPTIPQFDYVLCNQLKQLPLEHAELVQGLLDEHYVNTTLKKKVISVTDLVSSASKKNNTMNTVYKGKTCDNGKGPQYEGGNCPVKLQKIIVAYLRLVEDKT